MNSTLGYKFQSGLMKLFQEAQDLRIQSFPNEKQQLKKRPHFYYLTNLDL